MKIFYFVLKIFLCLIVLTIFLWLGIGYVNDQRLNLQVIQELKDNKARKSSHEFLGHLSSLSSTINYSENPQSLDQQKKEFEKTLPFTFFSHLHRHKNPLLSFLAAGYYPYRLEGHDGFLIRNGQNLTFNAAKKFDTLELEAISFFEEGEITINDNQGGNFNTPLKILPQKIPLLFGGFRWVHDFIIISKARTSANLWTKIVLDGKNADRFSFSCKGKSSFCFVSDPRVFKKTAFETNKPNFLFILIDTFRYEALKNFLEEYPGFDPFFGEAINYKNTYAAGNMTAPSANAVLSCQKPFKIEPIAFSYSINHDERDQFYKNSQPSFAEILGKNGYVTKAIGNISLTSEVFGAGVYHGFDTVISTEYQSYETPFLTLEFAEWMQNRIPAPFVAYLHFNSLHAPYKPPVKDIFKNISGFSHFGSLSSLLNLTYKSTVYFTMRYLRDIFEILRSQSLYDSTEIFVTSDHGDQFAMRNFYDNKAGPIYYGAYYDHGGTLYDDEIRIPLLWKPSKTQSVPVVDSGKLVQNLDIGPTILKRANLSVPSYCSGQNLSDTENQNTERILSFEGFKQRGIIFEGRYKYIFNFSPVSKNLVSDHSYFLKKSVVLIPEELYDLKADPQEHDNLFAKDLTLLNKARQKFSEAFELKQGSELVIENPNHKKVRIVLPQWDKENVTTLPESCSYLLAKSNFEISCETNSKTFSLVFNKVLERMPKVYFDEDLTPLLKTSYRISLNTSLKNTPTEAMGENLVPTSNEKAYIKKVWLDSKIRREISSTNPEFEKVLKEWGYLNDN